MRAALCARCPRQGPLTPKGVATYIQCSFAAYLAFLLDDFRWRAYEHELEIEVDPVTRTTGIGFLVGSRAAPLL
jgi:hypothetical protein